MPVEQRRWRWIGHSLKTSRQHYMMSPNLESRGEKAKRTTEKHVRRRDLEADVKEIGYTWRQLERLAQDRSAWHSHVGSLAPEGATKTLVMITTDQTHLEKLHLCPFLFSVFSLHWLCIFCKVIICAPGLNWFWPFSYCFYLLIDCCCAVILFLFLLLLYVAELNFTG